MNGGSLAGVEWADADTAEQHQQLTVFLSACP
jgi:hypothetical protein